MPTFSFNYIERPKKCIPWPIYEAFVMNLNESSIVPKCRRPK